MPFSSVNASARIVEKYLRYLNTIFEVNDKEYSKLFKLEVADSGQFFKGPYLDVSDSFKKALSPRQMVQSGELSNTFIFFGINQERELYSHQYKAISKVINGKNIVVSTGTGSGKTESFLIPILNELARQKEQHELSPGVRALLIYPMNALANDQIERLRVILKDYPEITFGSYTGQTETKTSAALTKFKTLNNKVPLRNELISREQMHATPPHILITNYSMLEYLMLRPSSSVFFEPQYAMKWKYIVLDEAHVYNGSTGIEVSMLLRRLNARLGNPKIQYILTSATLGSENEDSQVVEFAQDLCANPFNVDDVIRAERVKPKPTEEIGELKFGFYEQQAKFLDSRSQSEILSDLNQEYRGKNIDLGEAYFDLIIHDREYWRVRAYLDNTNTVKSIAKHMAWTEKQVEDFVTVASKAVKNDVRLFDARYHMFVKATESVFITLPPLKRVFLERKTTHFENGKEYKVFDISTCMYCHSIYIHGEIDSKGLLQQKSVRYDDKDMYVFLLKNEFSNDDEDTENNDNITEHLLCPYCGKIVSASDKKAEFCEHEQNDLVKVFKISLKTDNRLTKCYACENKNSQQVLHSFYTGQEAVTSVLSTALYEELPSQVITESKATRKGFGKSVDQPSITSLAKQFLAFSDSRQAAAYFASYFESTYTNLLYKRLIIEYLKKGNLDFPISLNRFIRSLSTLFKDKMLDGDDRDSIIPAAQAVYNELFLINTDNGLVKMGLFNLAFDIDGDYEDLGLNSKELNDLCMVITETMMQTGAIYIDFEQFPLTENDIEYFSYSSRFPSFKLSVNEKKSKVFSFIPAKENGMNKRLDYVIRIMKAKGKYKDCSDAKETLETIFDSLVDTQLIRAIKPGDSYQVDSTKMLINETGKLFQCEKCYAYTIHNISNICPRYKCEGCLREISSRDHFKDNHYYNLYTNMISSPMKIVEHTAQLSSTKAYEFQKDFVNKKINILSCSTTFEMGVDVGTLETVFLRNMPPSPANYAQRAGRAGRSKQSAAYALTFCNKSSHDFSYFNHPVEMIKGKIKPPKFNILNEKIAIRHVYATALSMFWRDNPDYFKDAESFINKGGITSLREYLYSKPISLKMELLCILPKELIELYGIEKFTWVDLLFDQSGPLELAEKEYKYIMGILDDAYNDIVSRKGNTSSISYRMKTIQKEQIISYFSNRNVLPKYGFPVDTVSLTVNSDDQNNNLGLELQRDLSIAISEYAPGSQIVANGKMLTSRYITKIPTLGWRTFAYSECSECKTLNVDYYGTDESIDNILLECKACHKTLSKDKSKAIIPTFGFSSELQVKPAGTRKPEKTHRSDVYYVGHQSQISFQDIEIGKTKIQLGYSEKDKLAILNKSRFYVCEYCGYGESSDTFFGMESTHKHKKPYGNYCDNEKLKRYSLGYIFETDVMHIEFAYPDIVKKDEAVSVLYGLLEGISHTLNIERQDINGALKYHHNEFTNRDNYNFVIFDNTPGGSGYVRQLNNPELWKEVMNTTLRLMENCKCGEPEMNTSCYSCLRNYYNQKHHDELQRGYVVNFIHKIFDSEYTPAFIHNENEWSRMRRLTQDPSIKELLTVLEELIISVPVLGYEFDTVQYSEAELAWIDRKVALLLPHQSQYRSEIEKFGWKVIDSTSFAETKASIIKEVK